ncbi:hypothetical protein QBC35DRAFT_412198 [Podospora australis]|uniref:Carrier domain-containing protein n=1 Tax=Podospora australis TaxID=1536484 RepID=A0AAN7AFG3_9PEZI|nr:hypothetical protein QBC35DRAFT_412198 [Podospora australis]
MSGPITPRDDVPSVFRAERASPNRLVHLIPDQLAAEVPEYPLFSYPKTNSPKDGFIDISARQFANAINRTAWYLLDLLGPPKNFESIGYMGTNDIRYFFFMFGAIKVGYKMCFVSPRNNLDGHLNVLKGVDCQVFLRADGVNVDDILAQRPMETAVVPELTELLDETAVPIYPYTKTFEEARHDPCLVLHTTGSTGLPKPITWKVAILSTYEAWRTIPEVDGYVPTTVVYQQARRAYTSMPLFHTSGLNAGITWALLLGVTLVYSAPRIVPNSAYTDEMHIHAGVDATMGAPSLYEELSRDPEALERLNNLKYVVASGAPLSQRAGALISQRSRVISNLGSTETACLQRLSPNIEDWDYFYWHPTHSGIEMKEVLPGLFEHFIIRKPGLELYQGIFTTFPDIQEWSMSDLYERHPDKPFMYRYKGRRDDVIVLSNGEKIAPALMEATLNSSPLVKGTMIVGRGKFQPAALIDLGEEPPKTTKERHELVEKLLPFINDANEHAPAHGQLDRYHILFADPKRPVHYLGQGKMQRHMTHKVYEEDIERLYEAAENPDSGEGADWNREGAARLDFTSGAALRKGLASLVAGITGIQEELLVGSNDLFELGVDSLHVIRLAREVRMEVSRTPGLERTSLKAFSPKAVYSHPTLRELAGYIVQRTQSDPEADLVSQKQKSDGEVKANGNGVLTNGVRVNGAVNGDADEHTNGLTNGYTNGNVNGHVNGTLTKSLPALDRAKGLLGKYVQSLPRSARNSDTDQEAVRPRPSSMTVILTGSTGSLGSYILDALNRDPNVSKIICLNRSDNAEERQLAIAGQRGLTVPSPSRVDFFKADLSKAYLGLSEGVYNRLRRTVTHIIHNQWPVNFNWPLSSFEPSIRGVRNLCLFSSRSTHNAFLLFVSSVSSVSSWKESGGVPEQVMRDLAMAAPMGYGQSKLIAENLLEKAGEISGVRSACCRVGIVAGPVESKAGMWNRHEYIPSVIISSAHLGVFPATFPSRDRVDWLPVDKVSSILLEILFSASAPSMQGGKGTEIFHVVNPSPVSWSGATSEDGSCIARSVLAAYPTAANVLPVSFEAWVEKLQQSAEDAVDVEVNPAVRLVEFYSGLVAAKSEPRRLLSERAEGISKTMREVGAVRDDWLRTWMAQWGLKTEWLRLM